MVCFTEIEKSILKFIGNLKGPLIAKKNLEKNNKVGGLIFHEFKTYYKVTVIKTIWEWHKDRYEDQCNRTESPEINPHINGQGIFHKDAKTIQRGKDCPFNMALGKLGIHRQNNKVGRLLYPIYKNQPKWIKNLRVRPKTIKLLEENRGKPSWL